MTYFPKIEYREAAPSKCPGCGKWFVVNLSMAGMSCLVNHGAGDCCHFSETEVPAPVPAVPREDETPSEPVTDAEVRAFKQHQSGFHPLSDEHFMSALDAFVNQRSGQPHDVTKGENDGR